MRVKVRWYSLFISSLGFVKHVVADESTSLFIRVEN